MLNDTETINMNRETRARVAPALLGLMLAGTVDAELRPISEQEMEQVRGQGMIAVDLGGSAANRTTRITLGLDAEVQTNIASLAFGDTGDGTDVLIDQLSLGHIATDANRVQIDGQTYAVDEIVPFVGRDPYIELAEENGEVIGFRVGFNQARGTLSGDIESFSGHLGIQLEDADGNVSAAQLFDANGNATQTRATYVGLADAATDCATNTQCAPLTNLQTLDVGQDNGDGTTGFTDDLFIAFQKQAVQWQDGTGGAIDAAAGVFLNVPTAMQLDLQALQNGIPRARTEYIDRGLGLF